MSRLAVPLPLAALLLLAACGGGAKDLPAVRRHLIMRPPESEATLLGTTVWKRFDVLRELPDWDPIASRATVKSLTFDETVSSVLWLSGPMGDPPVFEVRIPGAFDPAEFNEFRVTVIAPVGEFELTCSLSRRGERVLTSEPVGIARKRTPQTVGIPLPRTHQFEEPFDNLALTFEGEGARIGLVSVHLRQRPLRSFLPSPTTAPRLIRIEDEWRAALGLSSKRPLEGHVSVPADAELRLLFATPPELDLPDRRDSLRISITGEEGQETALRVHLGPGSEVVFDPSRKYRPQKKRRASRRRPRAGAGGPPRAKPVKERSDLPTQLFVDDFAEPQEEAPSTRPRLQLESPWTELSLPLEEFAGQQATVRVELVDWPDVETVCAVTLPAVVRPAQPANRAWTVLLITASAFRADHLGASGSEVEIDTALLDQLAEHGVLFEDCLAPSNDTATSLSALMLGSWPPTSPRDTQPGSATEAASTDAPTDAPDAVPTSAPASLAQRFRQGGFATWAVLGSAQLNPDFSSITDGFDRVLAPELGERTAGETIDQLIGHLDELPGSPLFVWLHLSDPQAPYEPPGNFLHQYYAAGSDPYSEELPELAAHMRPEWAPELRDPAWPAALYRSEITYLDRRLRDVFEHPRLRRGGIIAFTADHGESLAEHAQWFSHAELFPETLAIPLVLSFPGAPAGHRVPRPVSSADLGRTLLDLAGLGDTSFPGQNLLERRDRDASAPRFAFSTEARSGAITTRAPGASDELARTGIDASALRFSVSPEDHTAAVQAGTWFLALTLEHHDSADQSALPAPHATRLFNLSSDPGCELDVLDSEPEVGRELREFLIQWLRAPPPGALDLPPPPPADCTCTECSSIR